MSSRAHALRARPVRRVATGTGATLVLAGAAIAASATGAHADSDYRVRDGDTVSGIAQRTGATVTSITSANRLADPGRIYAGQVLRIPSGSSSAGTPTSPTPSAPAARSHTVRGGDTVSAIARAYGSTVAGIVHANGLDRRAFIRVGQQLTIPGRGAGTPTAPAATTPTATSGGYTVRAGDTVSAIAARHGTTVQAVVAANGLDARAFIRAGQRLTVPGASAGTTSTTSTASTDRVGSTFAGRTYADDVVAAANANKSTLVGQSTPTRAQMQEKVRATASQMGVDPALALAVAYQESGFNHTAVSPANAIGTMQVIPTSGEWASQMVGRDLDLLDPDDNVVAGVAILRTLVRTSPDLPTAIASYYQGAGSVQRHGMYADTRRYVANVQTLMSRFG
ncbi:LysM peptidoglycan-binding domain-containing protein [Cellulomonas sp. SLBN-39]|uniref:LysM peptidoglycan-binding domain-containing protein n=1 Tax=Cellulomonas sp. SLBN-39 TaxID=2768446 RepID=UPI0011515BEC|nr:LysM peptidoglycan-binding domain-containing protein [Cellulomonas sp. SLBN-39]TQL03938.1 LysM domain-containing protein [Cellulomonas sp. SLBN-39]